jgi:hypothetical protein
MNYIIEDDFDFFKELNETTTNLSEVHNCMISHLPLTYNTITLPCKHSFNYLPLYTELCLHNNKQNISCPYCREISNKLIPFIPLPNVKKIIGVNSPEKKCLPAPKCDFKLKTGLKCERNGIESKEGIFCTKHHANIHANIHANSQLDIWTTEMEQLSKNKSVIELKEMLRLKGLKVCGVKKELVKRLFT